MNGNESPTEKKKAKSAENISAIERLLKIKTSEMTFRRTSSHFVSASS